MAAEQATLLPQVAIREVSPHSWWGTKSSQDSGLEAEPATGRKRALGLGALVLLAGCGVVGAKSLDLIGGAGAGSGGAATQLTKVDMYDSVAQTCDDYDDDVVFTYELCGSNDAGMCGITGDDDDVNCMENEWCSKLCGEDCSNGEGALCFFETLSDLTTTCEGIRSGANNVKQDDSKKSLMKAASAQASASRALSTTKGSSSSKKSQKSVHRLGKGHGPHYEVSDYGCGTHAFCEHCTGSCASERLSRYATETHGLPPNSNLNPYYAKLLIMNIEETCEFYGNTIDEDTA